ncbi:zinc finger and BTB domain-containing protein 38 [Sarotherodon galilaeus]
MRGLTLLCLVGFILTASTTHWHPLENPLSFPTEPTSNETLHPNNATHAGNATEVHHNNRAEATVKEDA